MHHRTNRIPGEYLFCIFQEASRTSKFFFFRYDDAEVVKWTVDGDFQPRLVQFTMTYIYADLPTFNFQKSHIDEVANKYRKYRFSVDDHASRSA